jgi:putative ABC transport system permease protein
MRWAWRLFKREWRQQLLVLGLLVVAVAATTAGSGLATNAGFGEAARFGTADHLFSVSGSAKDVAAQVAAARKAFSTVEVIAHQRISVPGSTSAMDVRAQDPNGPYGRPTLRLLSGRYPTGSGDIAVTKWAAATFHLHLGGTWQVLGRSRVVVGMVENPWDLSDRFALVAPGQAEPAALVTLLVHATDKTFEAFHAAGGGPQAVAVRPTNERAVAAVLVLVMGTIGLLFVGLVAVAGFTVMAQRRLRALGMLGAVGATDRHIRLVLLVNGLVVGATAAALGLASGLAAWLVFAGRMEGLVDHRIARFDLPWWAIGTSAGLACLTSVGAAWWPARVAARIPIVAALSGRPSPPRPTHRFAALGALLLVVGPVLLDRSHKTRPPYIVGGVVTTAVGILLLAPVAIAGLAVVGRRAPIAIRLAVRDLARYQARSGAALAAVSLALGISASIVVSAAAAETVDARNLAAAGGPLPTNAMMVWFSPNPEGFLVPTHTAQELRTAQDRVRALGAQLHATSVLALEGLLDPSVTNELAGPGVLVGGRPLVQLGKPIRRVEGGHDVTEFKGSDAVSVFVATPAVLARYGITDVPPDVDVLTARRSLTGYELIPGRHSDWKPVVQHVGLPSYSSEPNTLITAHAMRSLGLTQTAVAWLVETPHALTPAQIEKARQIAAAVGLSIETRPSRPSQARLRTDATAAGFVLALGVLAMTVGLIRAETARDLRTLTATGASTSTRRTLTGATAASLALLGALLGTGGAYVALLAWNHKSLDDLAHVPFSNLAVVVVGLPLAALVAGWALAGREPDVISRQPME